MIMRLRGEIFMIEIKLTRGQTAIIDEIDSDLASFKWHANDEGTPMHPIYYAVRKGMRLHRVILERIIGRQLLSSELSDHINCDSLDNRRSNLRIANKQENAHNRLPNSRSGTRKGFCWFPRDKKWLAYIHIGGKFKFIGLYKREEDAAIAYETAAKRQFGEFYHPNLKHEK
jgi:hypothetical protein